MRMGLQLGLQVGAAPPLTASGASALPCEPRSDLRAGAEARGHARLRRRPRRRGSGASRRIVPYAQALKISRRTASEESPTLATAVASSSLLQPSVSVQWRTWCSSFMLMRELYGAPSFLNFSASV